MRTRNDRLLTSSLAAIAGLMFWGSAAPRAVAAPDRVADSMRESIDIVFVLDNSGSMKENDPEFLTRTAVSNFAHALAEDPGIDGRIAIVLFDGKARLVRQLTSISAGETDALLREALSRLDFSGQHTNSPAGVERALYELRQNGRNDARRAIVILSDGKIDTGETQADLEAARWLRDDLAGEGLASGIRIFGVAFTDAADYQLMQALARRTQGRYYRAFEATDLANVIDDVLATVVKDDFYETPLADGSADDSALPKSDPSPDVASAPSAGNDDSRSGLVALLPIAALFLAGALYWRYRGSAVARRPLAAGAQGETDAPAAQLLDIEGKLGKAGAAIALARGRTRIGRDMHNEIAIEDDAISSEHAVIEYHDGRYWLEDLKSTNGTCLGDQRLSLDQRVQLKGGDHIRLADVDLMFVLAGYVPGGATIFLNPTTTPPDAMIGNDPASGSEELESGQPDASAPMPGQLSLLQTPEPVEPELEPAHESSGSPGFEEVREPTHGDLEPGTVEIRAIRECLDYHIDRVSEISAAFASFIERAFNVEIRDAVSVSARDLISQANDDGRIVQKDYTFDGIRFVICGVPGDIDTAREFFVETFGGFTRMLSEQLHADSFRTERCRILAVLTFGLGTAPWVSLSIVPDEGQDPRIDLLSYEFLTEEELQEIEPSEHTDLSQSGLG